MLPFMVIEMKNLGTLVTHTKKGLSFSPKNKHLNSKYKRVLSKKKKKPTKAKRQVH